MVEVIGSSPIEPTGNCESRIVNCEITSTFGVGCSILDILSAAHFATATKGVLRGFLKRERIVHDVCQELKSMAPDRSDSGDSSVRGHGIS